MHAATGWIRSFGQNGPSATRISTGASRAFIASGTCEPFRTTVTAVPVAARTTVSFAGTGTRAEAGASASTGPSAFVVTTATAHTSATFGASRITGTTWHARRCSARSRALPWNGLFMRLRLTRDVTRPSPEIRPFRGRARERGRLTALDAAVTALAAG
jgi:hypothetical protein